MTVKSMASGVGKSIVGHLPVSKRRERSKRSRAVLGLPENRSKQSGDRDKRKEDLYTSHSTHLRQVRETFRKVGHEILEKRTNNYASNLELVREVFKRESGQMCVAKKEFQQIELKCPHFDSILSHILILRIGLWVQSVGEDVPMQTWTEEKECRRVGRSMAVMLRMSQTGAEAIDAWKLNYKALETLFRIDGFNEFMVCRMRVDVQ